VENGGGSSEKDDDEAFSLSNVLSYVTTTDYRLWIILGVIVLVVICFVAVVCFGFGRWSVGVTYEYIQQASAAVGSRFSEMTVI
jgi:hypothetical protein